MNNTAYLGNHGEYTDFYVGDRTISFLTSKRLEKYEKIVEWDNGYLVVMRKCKGETEPEEDYIDLVPILENLLIEPEKFLQNIERVEIKNE